MIDLLRSLPQGVYWYPVIAALAFVAVRTMIGLASRRPARGALDPSPHSALLGYATLVQRAGGDSYAEHELERLCIGMLLQTAGYRGYSVDACRRYMSHEAPAELVPTLREHLGDPGDRSPVETGTARPDAAVAGSGLPIRAELILREVERQTKEGGQ